MGDWLLKVALERTGSAIWPLEAVTETLTPSLLPDVRSKHLKMPCTSNFALLAGYFTYRSLLLSRCAKYNQAVLHALIGEKHVVYAV